MHGGKRQGAGRKKQTITKVRVSYRLAPDLVDWLRTFSNQTEILTKALREYKCRKK